MLNVLREYRTHEEEVRFQAILSILRWRALAGESGAYAGIVQITDPKPGGERFNVGPGYRLGGISQDWLDARRAWTRRVGYLVHQLYGDLQRLPEDFWWPTVQDMPSALAGLERFARAVASKRGVVAPDTLTAMAVCAMADCPFQSSQTAQIIGWAAPDALLIAKMMAASVIEDDPQLNAMALWAWKYDLPKPKRWRRDLAKAMLIEDSSEP